jgi:hypothetical protein
MSDKWFAECLLCKWEASFVQQDDAVTAASDHVANLHHEIPVVDRARDKIGHVQLRTETSPSGESGESGGSVAEHGRVAKGQAGDESDSPDESPPHSHTFQVGQHKPKGTRG